MSGKDGVGIYEIRRYRSISGVGRRESDDNGGGCEFYSRGRVWVSVVDTFRLIIRCWGC